MTENIITLQQALKRVGEEIASPAFLAEAETSLQRHGKIRYTIEVTAANQGINLSFRYSPVRNVNLLTFIKLREDA